MSQLLIAKNSGILNAAAPVAFPHRPSNVEPRLRPAIRKNVKNPLGLLGVGFIVLIASILLFARLGHYALWDDEANTALIAKGVCATGDTSAVIGHNIVAYEGGWELNHLCERYIPPLPYYLTAASFSLFGQNALTARLPFALCGLGFFALIALWLWRDEVEPWTWGLTTFALLTNVSLILYFRQCRYYALSISCTASLAYLYLHWTGTWRQQLLILIGSCVLLASNYISFGAAVCCFSIDWCFWGRKTARLGIANACLLFGAIALAGTTLLAVYAPFATAPPGAAAFQPPKLVQAWWNIRDLSVNEFWIIPLLALVPVVWYQKRDIWLLRGGVALVVYFVAVNMVEPHHGAFPSAEVRYLTPIMPLCCFLQVRALLLALADRKPMALLIGVSIIGTNLLSGGTIFHSGVVTTPMRSTFASYISELKRPPPDPYTATSQWINTHLPANSTLLVLPQYATYPLMFHAPAQVYAWQLDYPPKPQFRGLSPSQFKGLEAPRFIVIFGRDGLAKFKPIRLLDGRLIQYTQIECLPVIGKDLFRPELFSRIFTPIEFDVDRDGVFILKRN